MQVRASVLDKGAWQTWFLHYKKLYIMATEWVQGPVAGNIAKHKNNETNLSLLCWLLFYLGVAGNVAKRK